MDGQYMLGSCNISNQSFLKDSESDVNVTDPIETKRVMATFFPNLIGGGGAANLANWVNRMIAVAAANYDMEKGVIPWAPVGLLTEYPYE
jgi:hypothetical protein